MITLEFRNFNALILLCFFNFPPTMAGVDKCVIAADKGFYSLKNVKSLGKMHLGYIIPLKRNSSLIHDSGDY